MCLVIFKVEYVLKVTNNLFIFIKGRFRHNCKVLLIIFKTKILTLIFFILNTIKNFRVSGIFCEIETSNTHIFCFFKVYKY